MKTISLHDKPVIETFLRKNPAFHLYSIGDLDEFFWPYTTWYGLETDEGIQAIVLLYAGQPLPVVLALSEDIPSMHTLLHAIAHILPRRFYTHFSPGLEKIFLKNYTVEPYGQHYKMILRDPSLIQEMDCSEVVRLNSSDMDRILQLYQASYPENWFDARMLETNQYFGLRKDDELVSIAGVHVYSETYGVAALGNITTHPTYRKQGYGTLVTARLCQSLLETVDHIGLNVKADNRAAIACYKKLGFEIVAPYGEFMFEAR